MNVIANPKLKALPKSSVLRLYDPKRRGNSFSLDGFPAPEEGRDWITRLVEIIESQGAIGMTTNQTLFRALMDAGALDERLRTLKAGGRSPQEIYWMLYNEAATTAGRAFGLIHDRWPWEGRVSQEASALLTELGPLVKDVQRIARAMSGVGAFTKIPNLKIGPQAIEQAVAGEGPPPSGTVPVVHPNITLVFSDQHYIQTVEGYLRGLGALVKNLEAQGFSEESVHERLKSIHSVNSLFVSRVDRVVDPMIEEALGRAVGPDQATLRMIKGKVAVAQAKKVYQLFEAIFLGKPFSDPEGLYAQGEGKALRDRIQPLSDLYASLKVRGADPQRLLVASSGVKSEQPYSSLLYVLPFLGPWTANTLPEGTLRSLSQWVCDLSDAQIEVLKGRNLMREPLPAIPTDAQPTQAWDHALLMTQEEREKEGMAQISPDQILSEVHRLVLNPRETSLRILCESLRDKGAASFTKDEKASLEAIGKKLATLS